MSSACTPVLVGVASPVRRNGYLSKTAKFPFRGMDYSPWSSKNLIDRNWLKKLMQVGVNVTWSYGHRCMVIDHSDRLNFSMTMDYSPYSPKGNLAVFER